MINTPLTKEQVKDLPKGYTATGKGNRSTRRNSLKEPRTAHQKLIAQRTFKIKVVQQRFPGKTITHYL
jgi:hypothetical protein